MERLTSGTEPDPKVHVFVLDIDPSSGLDECLSCLNGDRGDAIRVERVSRDQMEQALGRTSDALRRVAIVSMCGGHGRKGDLLGMLKARWPELPVLVVTQEAEPDDVCRWLAAGAADYVTPPLTPTALVPRVLHFASTAGSGIHEAQTIDGLVGRDPAFSKTVQQIRAVARCDGTVLIEGETGTGKEVCARAIHRLSARRALPFSAINCAPGLVRV